jgi:hypothetical protein
MRAGLRLVVLAALVSAILPAAALAAGGVGGGGAARPLCTTGPKCTVTAAATNFTLNATIGPMSPFTVLSARGTARYEVKNGRTTLVVGVKGLDPLAGQPLDVYVGTTDPQIVTQQVVSPTGTIDWSLDSAAGDVLPAVGVFTTITFATPSFDFIAGGTFR